MIDVKLVITDDWQGIYFDGKLVSEGHHVSLTTVFNILQQKGIVQFEDFWIDPEHMEDILGCTLPADFKIIPKDIMGEY